MQRIAIPPHQLVLHPFQTWEERWFLLTAGDFATGAFNCMTVAWGSMGVMWHRPFVQVVVRPTRHTHRFLEEYPTFTLCLFPPSFHQALLHLGTVSGRDGDKLRGTGLTPTPSSVVAAPSYREAELVLECVTMYRHRIVPEGFVDRALEGEYPHQDYHSVCFGHVVAVWALPSYAAPSS